MHRLDRPVLVRTMLAGRKLEVSSRAHASVTQSNGSCSRMVVHTGLTKIRNLSSSGLQAQSDWPIFYLAECCPNLKYLVIDYAFTVTDGKCLY